MPATSDWTSSENGAIVDAYLLMLDMELRGEAYVKARINRQLQEQLGRSHSSIEWKLMNVSAVLREMSHPIIRGYQPAPNYQDALRDEVLRQIQSASALEQVAVAALRAAPGPIPPGIDWNLVSAPKVEFGKDRERLRRVAKRDYVQLEASNRALGLAGEEAVLDLERFRLRRLGLPRLADRVEHVSQTQGDGLGFDITSFEPDGTERLIEVKTTTLGPHWPMMISRNEVIVSQRTAQRYHLYRVFDFRQPRPGLYELAGALTDSCELDATTFEALPRIADRAG